MAHDPSASQDAGMMDAEYRDGKIIVPSGLRTTLDAQGITRVRVQIEPVSDKNGENIVRAIMRVQHADREVVTAMLAAAGSLAAGEYAGRARRQWNS